MAATAHLFPSLLLSHPTTVSASAQPAPRTAAPRTACCFWEALLTGVRWLHRTGSQERAGGSHSVFVQQIAELCLFKRAGCTPKAPLLSWGFPRAFWPLCGSLSFAARVPLPPWEQRSPHRIWGEGSFFWTTCEEAAPPSKVRK